MLNHINTFDIYLFGEKKRNLTLPHTMPSGLLPELVPVGQAVFRSQNIVLRRDAVHVLCADGSGQEGLPPGRLLLQGEGLF